MDNVQEVSEKITNLINSKITPLPRYEINTFIEDGKDFLELKVGDGPSMPYYVFSDEELFLIKLYKSIETGNVRNSTINQIRLIFSKTGYSKTFSREDIKNILDIKDTRTTNLIALLLQMNLIIKVEGTKYKFQK